ncbi:hypothetical protein OIU77_007677 [Salix suchowensis]|uniref:Uncharacterized protein n=1 Tax=Salix suchowensis TaxID=1278906 RepID=A0ABQ9AIB7_9ROSI|nr:hypothetical protein OIU77_007677 [Salix suchowensis]
MFLGPEQLGSLLSIRGCYQYHKRAGDKRVDNVEADAEQGACGKWAFIFQILFQMNAGAVMLTDCVFWFILVPFLAIKDYHLSSLIIGMHSLNVVFLLGDTALNCLRFPWFRMAYFFTWTIVYVLFQWIVHATFRLWWPYPFLDLSSPYAPFMVLLGSSDAHPLLLCFRFYFKAETHYVFKMVPRVLSMSEVEGLGNLESQHSFKENVNFCVVS